MNRIRLKFAWLPTKVEGRWIWLKQYWVRERWFETYGGFAPSRWVEMNRTLGVDTL